MNATKAAVEEGIVPGGGVALLRAKAAIGKLEGENADVQAGVSIVLRALEAAARQIVVPSEVRTPIGVPIHCFSKHGGVEPPRLFTVPPRF